MSPVAIFVIPILILELTNVIMLNLRNDLCQVTYILSPVEFEEPMLQPVEFRS